MLEICWASTVVARHHLRPLLRRLEAPQPASAGPSRLELRAGDYDVEAVDLPGRYGECGCTGAGR